MFKGVMQFKVTTNYRRVLENTWDLLESLERLGEKAVVVISILPTDGREEQSTPLSAALSASQTQDPVEPTQGSTANEFWDDFADDLKAIVDDLYTGQTTWRTLELTDKRAIALHVIRQLAGEDKALSMFEFESGKPSWMPTANAVSQMFMLRWSEVVQNATR